MARGAVILFSWTLLSFLGASSVAAADVAEQHIPGEEAPLGETVEADDGTAAARLLRSIAVQLAEAETSRDSVDAVQTSPETPPELDQSEMELPETQEPAADESERPTGDDELGILRVRKQTLQVDDELGLIRIRETPAAAPLPETFPQLDGVLTGRVGFFGGSNLFQSPKPFGGQVFQTGAGFYLFPKLSPHTNLFVGVEGNVVRYAQSPDVSFTQSPDDRSSDFSYNELQFQAGVRKRLSKRAYGQLYWRHQALDRQGVGNFFTADYIELLLSRRDVLGARVWLDSFYQIGFRSAQLTNSTGFDDLSRFSQFLLLSLNYGFTPQSRVGFFYQLYLDDYTHQDRHDTYHQIVGQFSYDLSPESRLNLFGGVKFGRSSDTSIRFDDIIYGASFSFNLPIF